MSTETRPYEDTICPTIYGKLLAAMLSQREIGILFDEDIENAKKHSKCLGSGCQMYQLNFKGCGLRNK